VALMGSENIPLQERYVGQTKVARRLVGRSSVGNASYMFGERTYSHQV
jgi:hypothetical protein